MKKVIIILSILLLCSCSVKNDNTMTITSDGKVNYSVIIAFDKQLLSSLNEMDIIDDKIEEYVTNNIKDSYLSKFKKEAYSDGNYIGNKYVYNIDNINMVASNNTDVIYLNESLNKNTDDIFNKKDDIYTARFIYNLKNKYNYKDVNFINKFTVNLPTRVIKHNADYVSNNGKTLVWNINNNEERNINFTFKINNNYAIISIVSLIFDVLFIIIFVFIYKGRKINA